MRVTIQILLCVLGPIAFSQARLVPSKVGHLLKNGIEDSQAVPKKRDSAATTTFISGYQSEPEMRLWLKNLVPNFKEDTMTTKNLSCGNVVTRDGRYVRYVTPFKGEKVLYQPTFNNVFPHHAEKRGPVGSFTDFYDCRRQILSANRNRLCSLEYNEGPLDFEPAAYTFSYQIFDLEAQSHLGERFNSLESCLKELWK